MTPDHDPWTTFVLTIGRLTGILLVVALTLLIGLDWPDPTP